MIHQYDDFPIIACSSGELRAAISIIRISGFKSLGSIEPLLSHDGPIEPKKQYLSEIIEESKVVDQVVFCYYENPRSYTGENLLEIYCHGNPIIVNKIINLFISYKLVRHAYPGEFSFRAMKNKKLSMNQVEGLDLLLNANTAFGIDQGLSVLDGSLRNDYQQLYKNFLEHKSALELGIDFAEDVGEEQFTKKLKSSLNELTQTAEKLHNRVLSNPSKLLDLKVTLFGSPNSGKSSLFNHMLKKERSIVSDLAGTTRDYISEPLMIEGTTFSLLDTAGLRETNNEIEQLGIKKTRELIENSFYNILVINPFDYDESYIEQFVKTGSIGAVIFTHSDMDNFEAQVGPIGPLFTSVNKIYLSNSKIDKICLEDIFTVINKKYLDVIKVNPILINRHSEVISATYSHLCQYSGLINTEKDISILSSELDSIGDCISELIGIVSPTEVLNNIFDNFCIGK